MKRAEVYTYRSPFDKLRASLNSTTLLTDDEGNPIAEGSPRYYAYGNERNPNSLIALPTTYAFTAPFSTTTWFGRRLIALPLSAHAAGSSTHARYGW